MKKVFVLVLAALLAFCGIATAEMDYSSMTDEELHAILDGVRAELARRETAAGGTDAVFEEQGVSFYYTGEVEFFGSTGLMLSLGTNVINDSDKNIDIFATGLTVNGLSFPDSWVKDIPAGQSGNKSLIFTTKGEFETLDIIDDLTATYKIIDSDSKETIAEIGPLTVHFNND